MSPRLTLQVDSAGPYAPGDTVRGAVTVAEGGRSRGLDVALEYHEKSPSYEEVARSVPGPRLHAGDLEPGASFRFEVPLPHDATPTFASAHGTLYWAIEARSDELGPDTAVSLAIPVVARRA